MVVLLETVLALANASRLDMISTIIDRHTSPKITLFISRETKEQEARLLSQRS